MNLPTASEITHHQSAWTAEWHETEPVLPEGGFLLLVAENHLRNFRLWHEEDTARRDDLGFEPVYRAKRAIDGYNQQRNDFIEKMDQFLVSILCPPEEGCPIHSETPGMMVDRLSILALKAFHMKEQTERIDAGLEHIEKCRQRLTTLERQLHDLEKAFQELVDEVRGGTRSFRVYFQFKMYNDPSLNPELYRPKAT